MNKTISSYNNKSKLYHDETVEFWDKFPLEIVDNFANYLNGKRVLDLGSGSGHDALLLRNKDLKVLCFDGSEAMVRMTEKNGFESILGDYREMRFDDLSFDGVWAYTSLLHVSTGDMQKVVRKIHSILKSGGIFMIGMIEGEFEGQLQREGWEDNDRYFKFYGRDELKKLIESLGFELLYQKDYQPHSKTYLNQIYRKV